MKQLILAALAVVFIHAAEAQTPTTFTGSSTGNNSPLTAAALNSAFGTKANATNGVLTNPTLNGGFGAGLNVLSGGTTKTLGNWMGGFVVTGGTSADLGAAYGQIVGSWPNLILAPSPVFQSSASISGATTAQVEFIRNGTTFTFVGATGSTVGISSSENLPITFANNGYAVRMYIDPTFGNVGIGTTTPAAKIDVNGQAIIIEQAFTPASSSAVCTMGTIAWDTNFTYVCVATNTWKRSALASF